jgi:hypothetical protein
LFCFFSGRDPRSEPRKGGGSGTIFPLTKEPGHLSPAAWITSAASPPSVVLKKGTFSLPRRLCARQETLNSRKLRSPRRGRAISSPPPGSCVTRLVPAETNRAHSPIDPKVTVLRYKAWVAKGSHSSGRRDFSFFFGCVFLVFFAGAPQVRPQNHTLSSLWILCARHSEARAALVVFMTATLTSRQD